MLCWCRLLSNKGAMSRWWLVYVVLVASMSNHSPLSLAMATNHDTSSPPPKLEPWQTCQIFMAPSVEGMGWGVYAGRSFQEGEIVEMAPGVIPIEHDAPASIDSALWDYAYGYYRLILPSPQSRQRPYILHLQAVMLGMGMIYNHHPTAPNLEFTTFGREPAPDVPWAANSIGFRALREIQVGEELFSFYSPQDYGDNNHHDNENKNPFGDGGRDWFARRNLTLYMPSLHQTSIPSEYLPQWKDRYCSKVVAGIGRPTWEQRISPMLPPDIPFWMDTQWLAPYDAEIGTVFAKVDVFKGQVIEWGSGMVLSQQYHALQDSPLGAIAIRWQDLQPQHQEALKTLRQRGQLVLQYNEWHSNLVDWNRTDKFQSWEDVALLPIGGNIGLVARPPKGDKGPKKLEDENSNCRLVIPIDHDIAATASKDGVVITFQLVATKDIRMGEPLQLDLPRSATRKEIALLRNEMQLMGRHTSKQSFLHMDTKDTPRTEL